MRSSTPSTSNIEPNLYIDWPIIIPKWPVDYLMDPIHYAKLADQLMQFRGKIPDDTVLQDRVAVCAVFELKKQIDHLLWQLDKHAALDEKGWIR